MRTSSSILFTGVCLIAAFCAVPQALAQANYPQRPIKIIAPFPPGGAFGTVIRLLAEKVSVQMGQPIIVDHKPGASGNIGAELVANAKPDGYTLLSTPPPPLVANQSLFAHLPFDPTKFVPVSVVVGAPNVLVAPIAFGANNLSELIALAKKDPGKLNYGSTGSGGTPHLTAEWLKSAAQIQMTHVSYKGVQAYLPLLAGEVDLMFMNLGDALPYIRSGRLKALAVASERSIAALPGVHPIAETIPGFISTTWTAVVATPGTPIAVAQTLSSALAVSLRLPDVVRTLAELHLEPIGSTPEQTGEFLREEAARWAKVIRNANIKPD